MRRYLAYKSIQSQSVSFGINFTRIEFRREIDYHVELFPRRLLINRR
ncbi:hypothetical protein [Psychroflexus lacisalsi]|nr:hypothetical protein [Psychroflexus lacisalsi]MBZ9620462.1 hypothetical protein [Psychroflexus lacisalsi]